MIGILTLRMNRSTMMSEAMAIDEGKNNVIVGNDDVIVVERM